MTRREQIARLITPDAFDWCNLPMEPFNNQWLNGPYWALEDVRSAYARAGQIMALDAVPGEDEVEAGAAAYLASTGTMFTWDYVVRNDPAWAERLRAASRAALTAAAKVRGGGE